FQRGARGQFVLAVGNTQTLLDSPHVPGVEIVRVELAPEVFEIPAGLRHAERPQVEVPQPPHGIAFHREQRPVVAVQCPPGPPGARGARWERKSVRNAAFKDSLSPGTASARSTRCRYSERTSCPSLTSKSRCSSGSMTAFFQSTQRGFISASPLPSETACSAH